MDGEPTRTGNLTREVEIMVRIEYGKQPSKETEA